MKIRTDFVTNSSSSSFIVAVKEGTTKEDAASFVNEYFQATIDDMLENIHYGDEGADEQVIKNELVDTIMSTSKRGLWIGDWKIGAGEACSENGGAPCVLHMAGELGNSKIKFKNTGC